MINNPDWYWSRGLHDAKIVNIINMDLDYDYKQRNPIRNYIEIILGESDAMFETTVKSIKFYNAKIIPVSTDFIDSWWIEDEITYESGKYLLKITYWTKAGNSEVVIKFDDAEAIHR